MIVFFKELSGGQILTPISQKWPYFYLIPGIHGCQCLPPLAPHSPSTENRNIDEGLSAGFLPRDGIQMFSMDFKSTS